MRIFIDTWSTRVNEFECIPVLRSILLASVSHPVHGGAADRRRTGIVSQRSVVQAGVAVASFVLLLVYISLLFVRIH